MQDLTFERLNSTDVKTIQLLASWYFDEWKIAPEITVERLTGFGNNGVPFHIVVKQNDAIVGTGGLYTDNGVGLLKAFPEYKKHAYWLALVYTPLDYRRKGIAAFVCKRIEEIAFQNGIKKLNLYTSTAEKLYTKEGWNALERISYKGVENVVMEKVLG